MQKATKTILITGATSGIGRAAALTLARKGHRVIATGRKSDALAELETGNEGLNLRTVRLDVTSERSIHEARAKVLAETDGYGIDVLINNAGYGLAAPFEQVRTEDLRGQFDTNVIGLALVTQAFLPEMRERSEGIIVNVSSMVGRMSLALQSVYCATKHAVEALSDSMRQELAGLGINVVLVEPGPIRTRFDATIMSRIDGEGEGTIYDDALAAYVSETEKMYRKGTGPEPVIATFEKIIASKRPRARYVTPWTNSFVLWATALLPTKLFDFGVRKTFRLMRADLDRAKA